jgi:hypothetical protein
VSIECLYKYRGLNRLSIQIFTEKKLYFAKACQLNDPYEISLPVTFEGTDEEIKAKLTYLNRSATDEIVRNVQNPNSQIRRELEKQAEEDIVEARNKFGICSFSEVNNDILLWSHYSDCHKGFCLEFDVTTSFFNSPKNCEPLYQRVDYPKIIPSNNYFRNTLKESVLASFLNKYSGWSYEKEWRLFGDPSCHRFEPECLKGVIFGYRMPEKDREIIRGFLRPLE